MISNFKDLVTRIGKLFSGIKEKREAPRGIELDALEPRVLFSGAPVEGANPEEEETAGDFSAPSAEGVASAPDAVAMEQGVIGDQTGLDQNASVDLVAVDGVTSQLNEQTLRVIADIAAQRWAEQGLTAEQLTALQGINYQVSDMSGNRLGVASGTSITIDSDAAGEGWYVDGTPGDDAEFAGSGSSLTATGGAATQGFDLLTAVMHEQGHVLGLLDEYRDNSSLMYGFIQTGQRRLASFGQADGAAAGTLMGDNFLTAAHVWTGAGDGSSLSDGANWRGGFGPSEMSDLVFSADTAGVAVVNDFAPGTRFNTILFSGGGYTLSGNAVELYGGLTSNHVSGVNTVDIDITLINHQTIMNANVGAEMVISGDIDTADLAGSRQLGTPALTFDGAGETTVSGVVKGDGGLNKLGQGNLILSGANTYEGLTEVYQGMVVVGHNNALGAVTGNTQVFEGAALGLDGTINGPLTVAEDLAIRGLGVGFGDGANSETLGALRNLSGTNVLTGSIDMSNTATSIGADAGSSLELSGMVGQGLSRGERLLKVGAGTVKFTGTVENEIQGEVRVMQGTLELGKTGGAKALRGSLVIGTEFEAGGTATVKLTASNQMELHNAFDAGLNTVTIFRTGVLDLNGQDETVGNVAMSVGATDSSDINLGGGTLTLGGASITVTGQNGSSGAAPAATISGGTLNLGSLFSGAGGGIVKTINVGDSQLNNIAADLIISADVEGSADVGFYKIGVGTLRLSGDNSALAGPFIMNGGLIEVGSDTAFGSGLLSLQNNGNVLRTFGGARTIANTLSLDGNFVTLGSVNPADSGDIAFNGNVTLTGGRTIQVMDPAQTVTFNGVIGEGIFGSQAFAKGGRGNLVLTNANTYSGATTVNQDGGTLILRDGGSLLNTNAMTVGVGGILHLDNDTGSNNGDRLNDLTNISLSGRLIFTGANDAHSSETLGVVTVNGSVASAIELRNTSGGTFNSLLTANQLVRNVDRTVDFIGTGVALSADGANRFSLINNPGGLDDGILPEGRVFGPGGTVDFATFGSSAEGIAIIALPASGYITDLSQANASSNVRVTADTVLTTSKSVNALLIDPGVDITGAGVTLTVNTGAIIFRDGGSIGVDYINTVQGTISVVAGEAEISADIFAGNVQKAGRGLLRLSGDNQTAGPTNVNEGILEITNSRALGAAAGVTTVRQGATLQINGSLDLEAEAITAVGVGFSVNAAGSGLDTYDTAIGAVRVLSGTTNVGGTVTISGDAMDLTGILAGFPAINTGSTIVNVATGATFTVTGDMPGASIDLVKTGGGTLEVAGPVPKTSDRNNRILEGTMLLNSEPGVLSSRGRFYVGSDAAGAPAATLKLGASDQIADDRGVQVHGSGTFDLDGNSELIGEFFRISVGPNGAGDVNIGTGGLFTPNVANFEIHAIGSGAPAGATITGGSLALQPFGNNVATARNLIVNDGATGTDLTITSAIVDGSGLISAALLKNGLGAVEFAGATANTYTGRTTVNEGTLLLNKTPGVNAMGGELSIGDRDAADNGSIASGYAGSDVVRWLASHQLADAVAHVSVQPTGWMDLNGFDETVGHVETQTALFLRAGAKVTTGAGTLTLNGNVVADAGRNVSLISVIAPATVSGKINLGGVTRVIDIADRLEVAEDLIIDADISGTAGFVKNGAGVLTLGGNNTYTGSTFINVGYISAGSDTALGTSKVYLLNETGVFSARGERTLGNEFVFPGAGTTNLVSGRLGLYAGGGGNNLTFTGPVNAIAGTLTLNSGPAAVVEFKGGIGETFGAVNVNKNGFGTVVISGVSTFSGTLTVLTNGGKVIIADQGTVINAPITVNIGGEVIVDNNSGANLANRIGELATVTLSGGTFTMVGKAGEASSEAIGAITLSDNTSSVFRSFVSDDGISSAEWRVASLSGVGNGRFVRFIGEGTEIGAATNNRIAFTAAPGLLDGILNQAVIENRVVGGPNEGLQFATRHNPDATKGAFNIFLDVYNATTAALVGGTFATNFTTSTATTNVRLSGNQTVILAGNTVSNAVLLADGTISIGGANLTVDTGLVASNGAGNAISAGNLTLGGADANLFVADATDLTISSAILGATGSLGKQGDGLLVVDGVGSAFTGMTRINAGTYRAMSDTAFGTTAGNVNVTYGSTLELAGNITVASEILTLNGNGESTVAAMPLRNVSGTNTWQGNVTLVAFRTGIDVEAGSELILNGVVGTTNTGFNKFGAGTLELGGSANNTFTRSFIVWEGTLELNKTGGAQAFAPTDVNNNLAYVGNMYGAANTATLKLLGDNQIADTIARVYVLSSGKFDLNGFNETLMGRIDAAGQSALELWVGSNAGSTVDLNGGTLRLGATGTQATSGRVTVNVLSGGDAVGANILDSAGTGKLEIFGDATGGNRVINVSDTTAENDLTISAVIASDGAFTQAIQKEGDGRLWLAGNNTYTVATLINRGEVLATHNNSLGTSAGNTTINSTFSLLLGGNITLGDALTVSGTGFGGRGAVVNLEGNNTLTGNITMPADTVLGVAAGTKLTASGAILESGGNRLLTKLLPGTLALTGSGNNTVFNMTIAEGSAEFGKTGGAKVMGAGILRIGNDAGGQSADQVTYLENEQLLATSRLIVHSDGRLDLANATQTIGGGAGSQEFATHLVNGVTQAGRIDTGATGRWRVNPTATGVIEIVTTAATGVVTTTDAPSAVISGNLDLLGHTDIRVDDAGWNIRELDVQAKITGSTNANLSGGTGILLISGNNTGTLTGVVTMNASVAALMLGHNEALGGAALNVTGSTSLFTDPAAITLANNITLNGDLTLRGDQDLNLTGTITNSGGNRTLTVNLEKSATANLSGTVNLSNDATSRTLGIVDVTFDHGDGVGQGVILSGTVQNGGGSTAGVLTLGFSNAVNRGRIALDSVNTYGGTTNINGGIVRVNHAGAFGAAGAAANTTVNAGATVELAGGLILAEDLFLAGNNRGFQMERGAVLLPSGTSVLSGNITIGSTNGSVTVLGVGDGAHLTANGTIGQSIVNTGLVKAGNGTLRLGGGAGDTSNNTFVGSVTVRHGVLELDKANGTNAFAGQLVVGDEGGGAGADVVRLLNNNQIAVQTVTVAGSGLFDLNGFSDAIGALTLNRFDEVGANVTSGAGMLILGGTVTVNNAGFTHADTAGAVINGNLALGATRNFDVNDTLALSANEDLILTGNVSGTGFGITKQLHGTMAIIGDTTFTGTLTVNGQELEVARSLSDFEPALSHARFTPCPPDLSP